MNSKAILVAGTLLALNSISAMAQTSTGHLMLRHAPVAHVTQRPAAPPRVANRPHIYNLHVRARVVQKLMDLPNPPNLGGTIRLEPGHLMLSNGANMTLTDLMGIMDNVAYLNIKPGHGPDSGFSSSIGIGFKGQTGKHYVIDCRASRASNLSYPLAYRVMVAKGSGGHLLNSGTVQMDDDGHFIFVTSAVPNDKTVGIGIYAEATKQESTMDLYGCDISPF